ncbi:MAG: serine/threonine-protein kinase [Kofleriaceae bacterium]|nr:serine/threonine-protein kinase [Kofleriaceae bacterium]
MRALAHTRTVALLAPGTIVVDDYRIERVLGLGGMGVVYAARDLRLGRDVALKVHVEANPEARARLMAEANALARVSHPNVVVVHRTGELGESVFIAMELVDGATLRGWLREREPGAREIYACLDGAGRGLAAAHAAGLVHRDFKPENVLVGRDGRARVADFGLAIVEKLDLTAPRAGTPRYMAPEQELHGAVDARADQYAFCVTAWEALTGQVPTEARAPRLPRRVEAVLRRGLAPTPDARFPSMMALLEAWAAAMSTRRRRIIALGGAALAGAVATGVALMATRTPPVDPCAEPTPALAASQLDAVSARLDAVRASWAAPVRDSTRSLLEAQTAALVDAEQRACRARVAHTWTDVQIERAADCLARRTRELQATASTLISLDDAAAARATSIAAQPGDPARCLDPARATTPRPRDPAKAQAIGLLETRLLNVRMLTLSGNYPEALRQLDALAADVRATGFPPLVAELVSTQARLASRRGGDVQALHDEAWLANRRAGLVDEAVKIALEAAISSASNREDAERWLRIAEADIEGFQLGDKLQVTLLRTRAAIMDMTNRSVEALPLARQAHAMARELGNPEFTRRALETLATVADGAGAHAEAAKLGQQLIAEYERALGPTHPELVVPLANLAVALNEAGELEASAKVGRRAVDLAREVHGVESERYHNALINLGTTLTVMEQRDEAVTVLTEARARVVARAGEDHPDVALIDLNLGEALTLFGRFDEGRTHLTSALAASKKLGDDDVQIAQALRGLGILELRAHRLALAERYFGEATEAFRKVQGAETSVASTLAFRAEVQAQRGDRDGARKTAQEALALGDAAAQYHDKLAKLAAP